MQVFAIFLAIFLLFVNHLCQLGTQKGLHEAAPFALFRVYSFTLPGDR